MSLERNSFDLNDGGAPSRADGSNTFIRIVAWGQTMAHLPQSMQMSGSQIGISWAIARFSYCAVAGRERAVDGECRHRQQVALAGHQPGRDPGRRSPGASAGRALLDASTAPSPSDGISTRARAASEASIAAKLRSTIVAPRRP